MKLGIHGIGVVGSALKGYLESKGHEVVCKDPKGYDDDFTGVVAVFICVPVPGKQDYSILESVLENYRNTYIPIFLRSTVLPGTADRFAEKYNCKLISMPEFLTARTADEDIQRLGVIHGPGATGLARRIFVETIVLENKECEIAKYVHNCFGALKVSYFNLVHGLCAVQGASYKQVMKGVLMSGHINEEHTHVPGPDGHFGFGGTCFPKDMEAFLHFTGWELLEDALEVNEIRYISKAA